MTSSKEARGRSRAGLWRRALAKVLPAIRRLNEDALEEIEERLILADFGLDAAQRLTKELARKRGRAPKMDAAKAREILVDAVVRILGDAPRELARPEASPAVYMAVGVNGAGKTTTLGKMALRLRSQGRSVLIAACDSYRAAAATQLARWAERARAEFVRGRRGQDPASIAYNALDQALAKGSDAVLVDTAGRLHTNVGLLEQLKKIARVAGRRVEGAPHETLLVLDATVGQNGLRQAEAFQRAVQVSGIVLTKMDSTAKGGIVVQVEERTGVRVKLVGCGEGEGDLISFDPRAFARGLLQGP